MTSLSSNTAESVHSAHPPHVQLTLIDVSPDLFQSSDIDLLLNHALDLGCICLNKNDTILQSSDDARERMSKSVMRFVKPQDRYLALGSMLLKSRAYHQSLLEEREEGCECKVLSKSSEASEAPLPLVELPRTKYNKPYLLVSRRSRHSGSHQGDTIDSGDEEDQPAHTISISHTISVSHQFPYVGITRLLQSPHSNNSPLHVGFDIVMYEAPNPKLYSTTSEFLGVFKNSFTPSEWGCIVDSSAAWFGRRRKSDENTRREFYLRWAVKEAYTKALGLGLGHEFGKFEVVFDCCEGEQEGGGLVEVIDTFGIEGSNTRDEIIGKRLDTLGTLRYAERDGSTDQDDVWHFTFLELQGGSTDCDVMGCACVCIGPLEAGSVSTCDGIVKEEVSTLEDVMRWHQRDRS